MKNLFFTICAILICCSLISCSKKKDSNEIIVKKPVEVKSNQILNMGDYTQANDISWVGAKYKVKVKFMADPSLPTVMEGNQKYYDNKIQLQVLRKDGSEFFNRTFTKSDFSSCLDDKFKKDGALLGIVYNYAKGDCLYFAASVGSPDKTSDEYIPLVLKLSKTGAVTISKDTQLDTASDVPTDDEQAEDDGI